MGNLARRVIVAVIGIPLAVMFIWVGALPLSLFLGTLAGLGAVELYRLARANGGQPLDGIGVPLAVSLPVALHLVRADILGRPVATLAVVLLAIMAVAVWARSPADRPLESIAVTAFGALYCGGTLAFAYALRHHAWTVGPRAGTALLLFPLVVTWATDTGAFFIGKAIGKRPLMPAVSPHKTLAGAIGGLLAAVVVGMLYNTMVLRPAAQLALAPAPAFLFAGLTSVAAQVGDLAESLLKREADVKDSSRLIPGHGGVLDRLDSIYFVLPLAYLFFGRFLLPAPA